MNVKRIAKAVVAVAGFVIVVGNQVVAGHIDAHAIVDAAIAAAVALGVYSVPNAR